MVGDQLDKSGLEFSEFLGNVDEVVEERFEDSTISMGDSFEQSSKAVRRGHGSKHHGEVLVMEKRDRAMSGGRGRAKGKSRKLRGGHGKLCV